MIQLIQNLEYIGITYRFAILVVCQTKTKSYRCWQTTRMANLYVIPMYSKFCINCITSFWQDLHYFWSPNIIFRFKEVVNVRLLISSFAIYFRRVQELNMIEDWCCNWMSLFVKTLYSPITNIYCLHCWFSPSIRHHWNCSILCIV